MAPGPPPGESLLDNHEAQNLNAFFTEFDSNSLDPNARTADGSQFHDGKNFEFPPDYVGSETSLGPRYGRSIDPQDLQPSFYNDGLMPGHLPLIPHGPSFDGMMQPAGSGYMNQSYSNPAQSQFQPVVDPQYHNRWLPGYHSNMTPPIANGRPQVRFGSDDQFHASGYAAPLNHQEPDMMRNLDWIEAQSSATNTQPNTQPNTEPSSPVSSRKRKFGDAESFLPVDSLNNYSSLVAAPHSMVVEKPAGPAMKATTRKRRKSDIKEDASSLLPDPEPGPPPNSKPRPVSKLPPPKRPSNRSKRKTRPSPEPVASSSRSRTSKTSGKSQTKPKTPSKGAKQSSRSSTTPGSQRQPLTQAEKKANHTNSEQRRRDATSRAYAEMYDLVPELGSMGKLSTTKKLECVVKKVRELKTGNEELERLLGED